ncbi:hypothetical protein GCM10022243_06700 [Saccharothrix violaceirubra]|uniref:Uncharacterized protein n=1 Tax=Saccharothrix violaceirubra TaxID=413306 RepID=A0A7W7SY36_9PSEU|nr:hypothetical protein [Saccharothrix violaceirubra]MBB4963082.1 hypothetical protein [Saccharothrix violaceirubra]
MQKSWKIAGVHADWTLTVDIVPPETDGDEPLGKLTRNPDFNNLVGHFRTIVEMNEALQDLQIT